MPMLPIFARFRLAALLCAFACVLAAPRTAGAQVHGGHPRAQGHHPAPREGISGQGVLKGEVVPSRARDEYTVAARIPSILDGLYCHCECHEVRGRRSLLECFEDEMASRCGICLGQARMADEMHRDGKSLNEIRRAIDDRYGD